MYKGGFGSGTTWKGNRNGRPRGSNEKLNKELLAAFAKAAKKEHKSLADYLVGKASEDTKIFLKLIDKIVPDLPREVGLPDEIGEITITITRREAGKDVGAKKET